MKAMVIIHGTPELEARETNQEVFTAMGTFNEELLNAGVMLSGEGLHPGSTAKRVRFSKRGGCGDAMTPEMRAREARLRARLEKL